MLDKIIQAPDQISALHDALSKRLNRRAKKQETETAFNKRRDWFRNFASRGGERLNGKGADALARITKDWELSENQINALLAYSTVWANCPEVFWHGGPPEQDILRNCFNDLERMREIDPLRRRILLITLSNQVQQYQRLICEERKDMRARKPKTNSKRERQFLPAALRSLTRRLWPDLSLENQEKVKDRITNYSRAGWKWQQLAHVEMLLSLQDSTVKG